MKTMMSARAQLNLIDRVEAAKSEEAKLPHEARMVLLLLKARGALSLMELEDVIPETMGGTIAGHGAARGLYESGLIRWDYHHVSGIHSASFDVATLTPEGVLVADRVWADEVKNRSPTLIRIFSGLMIRDFPELRSEGFTVERLARVIEGDMTGFLRMLNGISAKAPA